MTEILTESFCERCGTRYTFESARRPGRLKGVRVLSQGLKNFVLSDTTSMDEAMAAARSDTDRDVTAHQLDAFHATFNFCMECRQYICPNCWNEAEARCLTCAPHLGHDLLPAPFADDATTGFFVPDRSSIEAGNGHDGSNGSDVGLETAGPEATDETPPFEWFDPTARLNGLTGAPIEPAAPIAPPADLAPAPSAVEDDEATSTQPEKAANQTGPLSRRFQPGQNLDAELEAYERQRAEMAATLAGAEPEMVFERQVRAEPEVAAEPEMDVAEPEMVFAPEVEMVFAPEVAAEPEVFAETEAAAEPEMVAEPEVVIEPEMVFAPEVAAEP